MISLHRALAVILGAALLAAPVVTVRAQPATTLAQRKTMALQYNDRGIAALEAGDGKLALESFKLAYEQHTHAQFVYNMGRAHELLGEDEAAIARYEEFVEATPKDPYAKDARAAIKRLRAKAAEAARRAEAQRVAAEAARQAEAQRQAEGQRQAEAQRQAEGQRQAETQRQAEAQRAAAEAARQAEAQRAAAEAARQAEAQRQADARARQADADRQPALVAEAVRAEGEPRRAALHRARRLQLTGLALGGVGLVAVGAGTYFGLHARSLSNELSEPGAEYSTAKIDEGEAADRNMIIAMVAGGVMVGGGAVLYFVGRSQASHLPVIVTPTVDGAAAVWTGSF